MPEKKNQHYVSQFLLRHFGHGQSSGLIRLHNIRTGLYVPHASIKKQACADYFYERGGQIETNLQKMENLTGPQIADMIRHETLPKWRSAEHHAILKFIVFQKTRTRLARDETEEHSRQMIGKVEELAPGQFPYITRREIDPTETPQMLLKLAEMDYHATVDLRYKLLRNTTDISFITSDHPVARYNQLYENPVSITSSTGLCCRGLQIFFPLNPKYLLVLFDSNVYKLGGQKMRVTCIDIDKVDAEALNLLQAVNADEHLYFSESTSPNYIQSLVERAEPFRRKESVIARTGPAVFNSRPHGTVIHTSYIDLRIGLDLHCMQVLPSARRKFAGTDDPSIRYRDLNMLRLLQGFLREVQHKRLREDQFEEYCKTCEQTLGEEKVKKGEKRGEEKGEEKGTQLDCEEKGTQLD